MICLFDFERYSIESRFPFFLTHTVLCNFRWHPEKVCVLQISQNIDGFMHEKTIHKAFRVHETL